MGLMIVREYSKNPESSRAFRVLVTRWPRALALPVAEEAKAQ